MILDVYRIQKRLRNVTLKIRRLANVQDCGQPKHHHVTSPTGCFRTRFNTPQPLDSPDMSTSSLLCQADKLMSKNQLGNTSLYKTTGATGGRPFGASKD